MAQVLKNAAGYAAPDSAVTPGVFRVATEMWAIELVVDGGGVEATITVSYQSEPLVGFLVPVAMHESYEGHGEHVVGTATYGRFRLLAR